MAEKKEIEILLDGKVYRIAGTESIEHMQKIANYVNHKEREMKSNPSTAKVPKVLSAYLMQINIADDYFKALEQVEKLKEELEKKEKEDFELRHEIADLQTQLSMIKRGEDPFEAEMYTRDRINSGMFDEQSENE